MGQSTLIESDAGAANRGVVIAEDDVLLRESLAPLLESSGFDVVGRAGDGSELLPLVRKHKHDLVLVDIHMPPTHSTEGLQAARAIRGEFPDIGILVLSAHVAQGVSTVRRDAAARRSPSRRSQSSRSTMTR